MGSCQKVDVFSLRKGKKVGSGPVYAHFQKIDIVSVYGRIIIVLIYTRSKAETSVQF